MATPFLPQELLAEIFSKLPQKSIGKCKCLSKYWQSLISTPQFLKLCLYGNLIMITPSHSLHLLMSGPLINNNNVVSRKLDLPGSWTQLIGSCNGLVLLANKETVSGVFVSGAIHWQACEQGWGIPSIIASFDLANEVFYDTGSPKFLNSFYKSLVVRGRRLCLVSSFHTAWGDEVWTMEERGSVESWKKFTIANENWVDWSRVKLLCSVGEEEAVLTTMEEHESEESWKRFDIPENKDWPSVKPECFVGEEGVVLRAEDGGLFVYDTKEGTMKAFVVDGVPACCIALKWALVTLSTASIDFNVRILVGHQRDFMGVVGR